MTASNIMLKVMNAYYEDRHKYDDDWVYWEGDDSNNDKPHMVIGRTFEPEYFDTRAEAEAFVRDLPEAVITYDGEIAIVEVGTKRVVHEPAEVNDWGE